MTWVKAAYNSVHGRIGCEWKKSEGSFVLNLEIPASTAATVFLPAREARRVTERGLPAGEAPGVKLLRQENGQAVYEISSGIYQFVSD